MWDLVGNLEDRFFPVSNVTTSVLLTQACLDPVLLWSFSFSLLVLGHPEMIKDIKG